MKKIFIFAMMLFAMASCSTQENLTLEGYVWKLTKMEGIPAEAVQAKPDFFTLQFDADETIASGRSNCNNFFGEYTLNDKGLTFEELAATRKMCPNMEQEAAYMAMFSLVDNYEINGDELTLTGKGKTLATFKMQSKMEPAEEEVVEAAAQESADGEVEAEVAVEEVPAAEEK